MIDVFAAIISGFFLQTSYQEMWMQMKYAEKIHHYEVRVAAIQKDHIVNELKFFEPVVLHDEASVDYVALREQADATFDETDFEEKLSGSPSESTKNSTTKKKSTTTSEHVPKHQNEVLGTTTVSSPGKVITPADYHAPSSPASTTNSVVSHNTTTNTASTPTTNTVTAGITTAPTTNYRLHIPAIEKYDIPVIPTDINSEDQWRNDLINGVGQDLSHPGQDKKMVIFGHSSNYSWVNSAYNYVFQNLNSLQIGNTIQIDYQGKRYTYKVAKKEITGPYIPSVVTDYGREELILFTCWPNLTSRERLIIYADPMF